MKEQIQLKDFLTFSYLSDLQASPDGRQLSYLLHQADEEHNAYQSYLHLYKDGKDLCLTTSGKERCYLWQDEETILFSTCREERDQQALDAGEERTVFYSINIHGGEAQRAFHIPLAVQRIQQVDEDTYMILADFDLRYSYEASQSDEEKERLRQAKLEEQDYEVLDELPFYANGAGYTNQRRSTLFLYRPKRDQLIRISEKEMQVSHYAINEDHTMVFFTGTAYHKKQGLTEGVYVYDIQRGMCEELLKDDTYAFFDLQVWGSQLLLVAQTFEHYGLNENPNFYLYDVETKQLQLLCEYHQAFGNSVGSDARFGSQRTALIHQNCYYFIATIGYSSILYRLQKDGTRQVVYDEVGSVDGFAFTSDGLLVCGMYDMKPQELYQIQDQTRIALTTYHTYFCETKEIQKPQYLSLQNDGVSLDGWVLLPYGYEEGHHYPAILDIHGGPKTVYGEVYYHEMQVWAALGYVVFFMNPRGSDGKGDVFADLRGAYGTFDYEDLMSFTDLVIETYPAIDQNRIGVCGGSYGGFMTNWIITHTNRFQAAASQRSIANWISFSTTSDIGEYFGADQQLASIWTNQEKLWWHSPLKYADRCTTPTLFIHSNEDYRCPYSEGLQMYSALCIHGVETRLCMFKKENHELSRSGLPKHRIRRLEEITNWMNSHLQ